MYKVGGLRSSDAVTSVAPSGENTADTTKPPWPSNVRMHSPVFVLQSFALQSSEVVTTISSPFEKAAEFSQRPLAQALMEEGLL